MYDPTSAAAKAKRSDGGDAFIRDPESGPARTRDDLAESLAEEFLSSATSANEVTEDAHDLFVSEELGGPFEETTEADELAFTRETWDSASRPSISG